IICDGIRKLAPFRPDSVFCVLGAEGDDPVAARAAVDDGLRRIAEVAAEHGTTVSIEPMIREGGRPVERPLVASVTETLDLLDRLGIHGSVVVDIWHLWDSPGILDELRRHAGRVSALQMNDFHPPRVWRDRLLPGDGQGHVREVLAALDEGGFTGWL